MRLHVECNFLARGPQESGLSDEEWLRKRIWPTNS
jgi:hypothetical protein